MAVKIFNPTKYHCERVCERAYKMRRLTRRLIRLMELKYQQDFEIIMVPNFSIHSIDRYPNRIRLFSFSGIGIFP